LGLSAGIPGARDVLASRELATEQRALGVRNGPPPFTSKDRSSFLQQLDATIQKEKRQHKL